MVKGTSRRVIVVDSPDTELFEQAIFIVRNDAMNRNGVTAQRLVDEACRVARTCGRTATCSKRSFFRRGSPALWGCIGAGGIALGLQLAGAAAQRAASRWRGYSAYSFSPFFFLLRFWARRNGRARFFCAKRQISANF